jgi:hypothetical protein
MANGRDGYDSGCPDDWRADSEDGLVLLGPAPAEQA